MRMAIGSSKKGTRKTTTQTPAKPAPQRIVRPSPEERTTAEAAQLLGMKNASSVRRLYLDGGIAGRKVGRALWITLDAIEKYQAERKPRGRPEGAISGESHHKQGPAETNKKAPPKQVPKGVERPSPEERTSAEAAQLLGMKKASSVWRLYLDGGIAGRLVGRNLWITLDAIEKYQAERKPRGRPEGAISGESHNKRGPAATTYQREYKRRMRAAAKEAQRQAARRPPPKKRR